MMEKNPKADLWSRIQEQKDFDSQVKAHIENLPQRMPKVDLWNAIENKLEDKSPIIPIWKYGMVAASMAFILALSGIAYLGWEEKNVEPPLVTEVVSETPKPNVNDTKPAIESQSIEEIPEPIKIKESLPEPPQNNEIKRNGMSPVEIPTIAPPELDLTKIIASEVIVPERQEIESAPTLHRVTVSWGLQDKVKLRANFGGVNPESAPIQQLGRADEKRNSIKIKFKKD